MTLQESQTSYAPALCFVKVVSMVLHELISNLHHDLHPTPDKPISSDEAELRGIEHISYPRVAFLRNKKDSAVAYWAEAEIFGGPVLFARRNHVKFDVSIALLRFSIGWYSFFKSFHPRTFQNGSARLMILLYPDQCRAAYIPEGATR